MPFPLVIDRHFLSAICPRLYGIAVGLAVLVLFVGASLLTMSICAGVVGAVAFQQVDNAPHAKSSAEGNYEGLQSGDGRSEKLHIFLRFSGIYPAMKKAAHMGRQLPYLGTTCPKVFIQRRLDRRDRHS